MRKCPNCSNEVQDDAIFCDQCGTRLPAAAATEQAVSPAPAQAAPAPAPAAVPQAASADVVCPSCGTHNLPGEAFCQNCGTKLEALQPAAATGEPSSVAPTPPGICPDCGATVNPDEEFCFACGADLKAARARTAAQAPAPSAAEAAAPAGQAAVTQPAAAAASVCPTCGSQVKPQDAFCEACGAALTQPAPAAAPAATPAPARAAAAGPRLVVVASGVELPFAGRSEVVVGREDPYSGVFPDIDLTPHGGVEGGVSRRHLKITQVGTGYVIEDLNSTNYTMLNHKRIPAGTPQPLADGDEVTAGKVRLIFKANA